MSSSQPKDPAPLPAATLSPQALRQLGWPASRVGVIVVDHGSRRAESNEQLEQVVAQFRQLTGMPIVEAAHMELAEPSITTAVAHAVQQGAQLILVHPYFLAPGRHWHADIPALVADAVGRHPGVRYIVTAPLGLHPLMQQIMQQRILHCLQHLLGGGPTCDVCADQPGCQLRSP